MKRGFKSDMLKHLSHQQFSPVLVQVYFLALQTFIMIVIMSESKDWGIETFVLWDSCAVTASERIEAAARETSVYLVFKGASSIIFMGKKMESPVLSESGCNHNPPHLPATLASLIRLDATISAPSSLSSSLSFKLHVVWWWAVTTARAVEAVCALIEFTPAVKGSLWCQPAKFKHLVALIVFKWQMGRLTHPHCKYLSQQLNGARQCIWL